MSLPPLILIHGYPFDHTMWKGVVEALGNKIKIIAPDLPGFGDNPAETAEPSIDLMADDVAKLFEFHHIERAVVAGMSMGGYVALALAERHQKHFAGIGLISTQPNADTPEIQQARRVIIEKVQRKGTAVAAEAVIPKLFLDANQHNAEMKRFPMEAAENAGVEGVCWALEAMARRPDRTALLRTLPFPAAVIHGTDDKIVSPERARKMSELISDSKYVEVPSGHASPLEAPKMVADALLDLLQRAAAFHPTTDYRSRREPGITIAPSERGL